MTAFDAHLCFGSSLFQRSYSGEALQAMADDEPGFGGLLIAARPYDYHYAPAQQALERFTAANPSFIAALRVDPWRLEEARLQVAASAAPVLFLHPMEEQFYPTHEGAMQLVEDAGARGMVVMIAAGYLPFSHPAQLTPLLQAFPKQRFIITHGGQINICGLHLSEAWELFEGFENTLFETSGIYRQDYIERAVTELGAERVLYGSGGPFYDPRYERKRIEQLDVEDADRAAILGGNARRLLGVEA